MILRRVSRHHPRGFTEDHSDRTISTEYTRGGELIPDLNNRTKITSPMSSLLPLNEGYNPMSFLTPKVEPVNEWERDILVSELPSVKNTVLRWDTSPDKPKFPNSGRCFRMLLSRDSSEVHSDVGVGWEHILK